MDRKAIARTAAFFLGAFASLSVHAAAISINATTPGSISFGACDFERGITVNGNSMGRCGVGSGGTVVVPGSTLSFEGTWYTIDAPSNNLVNVYFTSAADPTRYSSLFSYKVDKDGSYSKITGSFTGGLNGLVPNGGITATAGTPYLFDYAYLTGSVSTVAVPEPGTLALAGLAMVAMGAVRRRN